MAAEHIDPIDWLLSDDVGMSSRMIFCHFLGKAQKYQYVQYVPDDCGDFGRCMRLLESPFAAGWSERIAEMDPYYFGEWAKLTPHWKRLTDLWYTNKHRSLTKEIQKLVRTQAPTSKTR